MTVGEGQGPQGTGNSAQQGNDQTGSGGTPTPPTSPPAEPPASQAASPAPSQEPKAGNQAPTPSSNVLTIPQSAMGRIKQEERERGQRMALDTLNAEASKLGFSSVSELMAAAAKGFKKKATREETPPAASSTEPGGGEPAPKSSATDQDFSRLIADKRKANRARAAAERENIRLKRELSDKEVVMELTLAAAQAGITDGDCRELAIKHFRSKVRSMNAVKEEVPVGYEHTYFGEVLRKEKPFLYGVHTVPATTGATASGPKPDPAQGKKSEQEAGAKDAREMSQEDYEKRLQALGLSNPSRMV